MAGCGVCGSLYVIPQAGKRAGERSLHGKGKEELVLGRKRRDFIVELVVGIDF